MTFRLTLAAILLLMTTGIPVVAAAQTFIEEPLCGGMYHGNSPREVAQKLLPQMEKLYNAIPELSPNEKKWLNEEITADGQRLERAQSSQEYALRTVKQDIQNLRWSLRNIIDLPANEDHQVTLGHWLEMAYYINHPNHSFANDFSLLAKRKLVEWEALPSSWSFMAYGTVDLKTRITSIRLGRNILLNHIVSCVIPTIIGAHHK